LYRATKNVVVAVLMSIVLPGVPKLAFPVKVPAIVYSSSLRFTVTAPTVKAPPIWPSTTAPIGRATVATPSPATPSSL
jgi:hypothetical protein